jgi:hypothetical protein
MKATTPVTTDFEISAQPETGSLTLVGALKYAAAGAYFGIVLAKAEVISWYRIQEMFLLESFHMYGVIGSAVVVGAVSVWAIQRLQAGSGGAQLITPAARRFHKGTVLGGLIFGVGWALTGACPGPIFIQAGAGYSSGVVILFSALAGTYVYGLLRDRLPH